MSIYELNPIKNTIYKVTFQKSRKPEVKGVVARAHAQWQGQGSLVMSLADDRI